MNNLDFLIYDVSQKYWHKFTCYTIGLM